MQLVNNVHDTALIFEGGGMRASYTAAFVNHLLENEIYFDYVAGISAGASHCVNYLSRDSERTKKSFVDLFSDPNIGGIKTFLKGEGYFRAEYIYEKTPYQNCSLPFDFQTFMTNPAKLRIGAFSRDSGELRYFRKEDINDIEDLTKIVRCSSSIPIIMPPVEFQGKVYLDGGLCGGIPLDIAQHDGMEKFFVILNHPKGYRNKHFKINKFIQAYYHKYPKLVEALLQRSRRYNQTLEELEELSRKGKALLVYPDTMPISGLELNVNKLSYCYDLGYQQGKKDLARWKEFLCFE